MARPDGSIFWYNQRWYEYTGTSPEQMEWRGWESVTDAARLPEIRTQWRAAIHEGVPFDMEVTLHGADDVPHWFLMRAAPVCGRDGSVIRWFGTSTDIQELHDARESARAASRAKSDFLATMSHELRTPLNAIGGYVELLDMELRGPITEAQRRDLFRIRRSQEHLLGLISSVLDLSRIESGKIAYDLAAVAVDPLLAGLDDLVAPQVAAKRLVLAYERALPGLTVMADREKLRQILLNLLSNAIRYTPAGGHIGMAAELGDGTVLVRIEDDGTGIPVRDQELIFEPFVQLDRSLANPGEGVGLGLAISRDLARGMRGDLTVRSTPGHGACFILTLPAAPAVAAVAQMVTGEAPSVRYS
jgi:signal transduction histidine kinase